MDRYAELRRAFAAAVEAAEAGKGEDRHGEPGEPFERQVTMRNARVFGIGAPLAQVVKKAEEAMRLPRERAQAEMLGMMTYAAAAWLTLDGATGSAPTTLEDVEAALKKAQAHQAYLFPAPQAEAGSALGGAAAKTPVYRSSDTLSWKKWKNGDPIPHGPGFAQLRDGSLLTLPVRNSRWEQTGAPGDIMEFRPL